MRYLKRFNEMLDTGIAPYKVDIQIREHIKKKIEEISYILNDVGLEAYIGVGANCAVVTIERRVDDEPTGIETAFTDKSYGASKRRWERSLGSNDVYLEFIDRIEEICEESGHKIYVRRTLNFTDKSTDVHYEFSRLYISNQSDIANTCYNIRDAIKYEFRRSSPGILNRSLTWVGKKLNLI